MGLVGLPFVSLIVDEVSSLHVVFVLPLRADIRHDREIMSRGTARNY